MVLGTVEDLLAGGLGDVEDRGDLPVRVVEGLAQHVHGPFARGQPLHEGEDRVRDRFALFRGVGRAEHRVPREQRLGEPLPHVGLTACPRRGELVEAEVGQDLRQPGLGDRDTGGVGGLPAQEGLLDDILGLVRGAEETVGDRLQTGPRSLEPVDVFRRHRHGRHVSRIASDRSRLIPRIGAVSDDQ
jgi:hypothetical protein